MKNSSDFLFAKPSFLSGIASSLDLGGTFTDYNGSKSPAKADHNAMKADFGVVSKDLKKGASQFCKEIQKDK